VAAIPRLPSCYRPPLARGNAKAKHGTVTAKRSTEGLDPSRLTREGVVAVSEEVKQQRIELIKTYWTALNTGDLDTFRTLLAPDAVIHYPGQHYLSGDYKTTDDIVGLYAKLVQFVADGVFHGEVLDILVGETYTSVVLRYDLKLPMRTIPGRAVGLFIIEDGKIKEYWLHEWNQVMINRVFRLSRAFGPVQKLGPVQRLLSRNGKK
jgi:ketosteroid isomerase-like protein